MLPLIKCLVDVPQPVAGGEQIFSDLVEILFSSKVVVRSGEIIVVTNV